MKNFFYSTEIGDQIKHLLDTILDEDEAKNITTGDFSVLPDPEKLNDFLPAVVITLRQNVINNGNSQLGAVSVPYIYDIYYLYPYSFKEFEDIPAASKKITEKISNIFLNYPNLVITEDEENDPYRTPKFEIEKSDTEAGGYVTSSEVIAIDYDNAETKLFNLLEWPMATARIQLQVEFINYM